MNTKEKAIAAVLFLVLLGVIFLWDQTTPETADTPKPGQSHVANGETEPVQQKTGDDGDRAQSQPGEPGDDGQDTASKLTPAVPTPGTELSAESMFLERFAALPAAEPHDLIVSRPEGATEDDPLATITVDPERGGIVEVRLNDYLMELEKKPKMKLAVQPGDTAMLGLTNADGTLEFSHAAIVEKTSDKLVIERQIKGTQVIVRQSWEVTVDSYRITYSLTVTNTGETNAPLHGVRMSAGLMEPLVPPKGMFGASGIDQRIQYREVDDSNSDYERISTILKFDAEDVNEFAEKKLQWYSVQNKFFTTSLFTEDPIQGISFATPEFTPEGEAGTKSKGELHRLIGYANLPELSGMAGESTVEHTYDFYVGSKNYKRLKSLRPGSLQEQIMGFDIFMIWHFGVMKYIALGIYHLLTYLFGVVGNFGLAIVLSTIVIRVAFSPITYKSSVWSQRMKEIQPDMAAIKEKYAADPQQMNMKVMALYRERKVNPVGGCLPIFFQIPVFFALFNVLRSAIELRHAEFLFVPDLSQPDMLFFLPSVIPFIGGLPFNILPFLMGGAMYLQQKLMPTSADPMQQKMMGFMTVFITFICYNMPAGLTLYWTVSNICSIFQYKITSKMIEKQTKAKES